MPFFYVFFMIGGAGLLGFGLLLTIRHTLGESVLIIGATLFLAGILLFGFARLEAMLKRHGRALRDELRGSSQYD